MTLGTWPRSGRDWGETRCQAGAPAAGYAPTVAFALTAASVSASANTAASSAAHLPFVSLPHCQPMAPPSVGYFCTAAFSIVANWGPGTYLEKKATEFGKQPVHHGKIVPAVAIVRQYNFAHHNLFGRDAVVLDDVRDRSLNKQCSSTSLGQRMQH